MRWFGLILSVYLGAVCAAPRGVWAQAGMLGNELAGGDSPPITFSNLIVRVDEHNEIARSYDDFRLIALETMRAEGFNAVGAENLVFGRDRGGNAEFMLGGTLREGKCMRDQLGGLCCRLGIEWQLFDVAADQVVYRAMVRHGECEVESLEGDALTRHFLTNALRKLLQRERFAAELRARKPDTGASYEPATFASCKRKSVPITKSPDPALDATVLVTAGMSHGSGFFASADGYVLTAAHVVVSNKLSVQTRDGTTYEAEPVRISRKSDVALLRVQLPAGQSEPCLPVATEVKAGSDVYAIGAPAERKLAFSLTRGIASGTREQRGVRLLQTDAPVSPGNSGGPLVDARGRAVAVVSHKVVGSAVEGVSFGIAMSSALQALGLVAGERTAAQLEAAPALKIAADDANAFVDAEDPLPSLVQPRVANRVRRVLLEQGFEANQKYRYFRGRFYLERGLFVTAFVAPGYADERFVVSLNRSQLQPINPACKKLELVINGRVHAARELAEVKTHVAPLHRGVLRRAGEGFGVEARFDAALLAKLDQHAPSLRMRTCGGDWALTPAQITDFRKLRRAYDALRTEQAAAGDAQRK